MYSFIKIRQNRYALKAASKEYKRQMNTSRINFEYKLKREKRDTAKTDAKKLWKILNSPKKSNINVNEHIQIINYMSISKRIIRKEMWGRG